MKFIEKYISQSGSVDKPLIVCFRSNADVDDVRKQLRGRKGIVNISPLEPRTSGDVFLEDELVKLEDHPELVKALFLPKEYREKTERKEKVEFVLFYYFCDEIEQSKLDYCQNLFAQLKIPTVFLVNDYQIKKFDSTTWENFTFMELNQEDRNPIEMK